MMAMHPTRPLDPMEILRKLTGLPHRRTYITEVWWLVGGTALGLLLLPALSWLAFLLVGVSVGAALVYFDWRFSPVSLLPPRATSQNIIGK
ncbi:MAG: hypothetical protein AMJ93_08910, partial [Anaerolineae bacterium SM23_84]